jgi:hypothetical protein
VNDNSNMVGMVKIAACRVCMRGRVLGPLTIMNFMIRISEYELENGAAKGLMCT